MLKRVAQALHRLATDQTGDIRQIRPWSGTEAARAFPLVSRAQGDETVRQDCDHADVLSMVAKRVVGRLDPAVMALKS